jgi:signal transduction histidine kinase
MSESLEADIAAVKSIKAIPIILDIVCRTTGMRFAAVARVTEDRWIACSVRDDVAFGLEPGGELQVESTICHEIRQTGQAVIIDHVAADVTYALHHTPQIYGLQSYISMPIRLTDGSFFGTLCAIDPEPHLLNTPETVAMFEMFADVIGFHLSAVDRLNSSETSLLAERKNAALREQFIAVLSHDLRNPLAAIDGGLRLLLKQPQTDKARTIIGMAQGSVTRMARLIEDVMDFARGRLGGGISIDYSAPQPLEPLLRHLVAELQTNESGPTIEAVFALHEPVICDTARIGQMVSNLLGNATTHGAPSQPIRLKATATNGWFELSVANYGKPIQPEMLSTIFGPFARGSQGASKQGLGLGLYISHEIARAHGGRISVTSTEVETCFTFRMPTTPPGATLNPMT